MPQKLARDSARINDLTTIETGSTDWHSVHPNFRVIEYWISSVLRPAKERGQDAADRSDLRSETNGIDWMMLEQRLRVSRTAHSTLVENRQDYEETRQAATLRGAFDRNMTRFWFHRNSSTEISSGRRHTDPAKNVRSNFIQNW